MNRRLFSSVSLIENFNWSNVISGGLMLAAGTSLYNLGNVHGDTNSRLKNVEGQLENVTKEVSKSNQKVNELISNHKILGEKIDTLIARKK